MYILYIYVDSSHESIKDYPTLCTIYCILGVSEMNGEFYDTPLANYMSNSHSTNYGCGLKAA